MKNWESWYLTGLEHLHDYMPSTPVTILHKDGSKEGKFKEWKGIISSILDSGYNNCSIAFNGKVLVCSWWKDKNSQIIIETLDEYMAMQARFGLVNY